MLAMEQQVHCDRLPCLLQHVLIRYCIMPLLQCSVTFQHWFAVLMSITIWLQILGALSFELTVPTAKTFLRRFLKAACSGDVVADSRLECLSSYLTELMLPEYRALQFLPSQVPALTFIPCCMIITYLHLR